MKTRVISLSDGLLFDGFKESIEEAWVKSVPIAIKHYMLQAIHSCELVLMNPHYQMILQSGLKPDADVISRNQAHNIISLFSQSVLQKREHEKQFSKSPLNILERSYAALKKFGFSDQAIQTLSNELGNVEYLHQYQKATSKHLTISNFAKDLFGSLSASPDKVEFLRTERKRERYHYHGQEHELMQPETDKLKEQASNITINHIGMVPAGSHYTQKLSFLSKEEGVNVLIVPINRLEKSLISNAPIHNAVAEAAKAGNLLVVAVSPKKEQTVAWSQKVSERLSPRLLKLGTISAWHDNQASVWFDSIKESHIAEYIASGKYRDLKRDNVVSAVKDASLTL
ncbi:MAG: hypothetical protein MK137_10240 [Rickettsiales bacterium]|nr:hypothetical protein [Rickettsiales bacterium]